MNTVELHFLHPLYALFDSANNLGFWKTVLVLFIFLVYAWCLCYILLSGAVVLLLVMVILILTERRDLLLHF